MTGLSSFDSRFIAFFDSGGVFWIALAIALGVGAMHAVAPGSACISRSGTCALGCGSATTVMDTGMDTVMDMMRRSPIRGRGRD
ncbi:hypothetical protein OG320_11030 [Microbispora sp. NBC_01189]|uniref:hypothetical protein n=1 Tax=Microbispora sp. NBC_01189 TaxID=2903583 RepID=UPI002E0F6F7C|nr:hypothetical protein OG320_11030 [Microbispora sp. NBC_01189]